MAQAWTGTSSDEATRAEKEKSRRCYLEPAWVQNNEERADEMSDREMECAALIDTAVCQKQQLYWKSSIKIRYN